MMKLFPDAYHLEPMRILHLGKKVSTLRIEFPDYKDSIYDDLIGQLNGRKQRFQRAAHDLVFEKHAEFLLSLGEKVPSKQQLLRSGRWHPQFDVEAVAVPAIELPTIPEDDSVTDPLKLLEENKGKLSDAMERALKKAADAKAIACAVSANTTSLPDEPTMSEAKAGISSSLLERV